MTDDEARGVPDPSPDAAAVRAADHDVAGDALMPFPTSHGDVPRESAVAVGRVAAPDSAEALDRLRRAGIPAFLQNERSRPATVYVDEPDAHDARIVLATLGAAVQPADHVAPVDRPPGDELTDDSVEERFSALIGQLEQAVSEDDPDLAAGRQHDAQRSADAADRVSARLGEPPDPPELQEEHFERPLPPPMPRPSRAGAVAIVVVLLGVAILAFGNVLGLNADESLTVGVIVTLTGALLLGRRLKQYRDDSDDGAVL